MTERADHDRDLASDIDLRIDDALRRAFTPPPAGDLARLAPAPARRFGRPRAAALVAAAAALLLVALWFGRPRTAAGPPRHDVELPAMWVAAYRDAVARGFDTKNCCDDDCDLKTRCRELFAAAIDLATDAGVEVCGAYCGPAGGAAAMLARAGEEPVCVFVLPRDRAPAVRAGDYEGLRIHRREVGTVVVFEVSRLPAARVLPHLYVPEG